LNCKICSREAGEDNYCDIHKKAYENIVKKYEFWKRALEVSWKEYLSEIVKNPLTGEWIKEVAEHLIESGEKQNVTNG
jgi:hypothetical protein